MDLSAFRTRDQTPPEFSGSRGLWRMGGVEQRNSTMKPKNSFEPHLLLRAIELAPGGELNLQAPGWYLLFVADGVGYWVHPRTSLELTAGSVLVFSGTARGLIRASQLSQVRLSFFRLQPDRLTGLVTWGEQQFLQNAMAQDSFAARLFPPTAAISEKFRRLSAQTYVSSLFGRLQMLEAFIEAFGADLYRHKAAPERSVDAKTRLVKLLNDTLPSEFLDMSFGDLVRATRCTPRHLSRIFQQVVGMSFRDKQVQVRLTRAQELLATTQSKVVEVAFESGYQSLSLFNLVFKRQFGLTPAKWRNRARQRELPPKLGRRLRDSLREMTRGTSGKQNERQIAGLISQVKA
jgi:AraC-like DNA-binding protein